MRNGSDPDRPGIYSYGERGSRIMRITLIYPSSRKTWNRAPEKRRSRFHMFPGLGLLTLAALSPPEAEIRVIDDEYEDIDTEQPADLVGISVLTSNAYRAYEISREFRERHVPVVLGGMHPTACPEEAVSHADAIVQGEAEGVWAGLLEDLGHGNLKKIYRSRNSSDLSNRPFPRRDLLNLSHYTMPNTIQASRGCPMNCEFCSMASLFGTRTRFRPVEEVVEEIKSLKGSVFLLNDDNIAQNFDYYKSLFMRLIPLKKRWVGEASWNIIQDPGLLELIQKSGCICLHIGFESLYPQDGLPKTRHVDNIPGLYRRVVRILHERGICVFGAFVFGFDNEKPDVFDKTLRFAVESHMEIGQFNIQTPYPGTRLYTRLKKEGRLLEKDWSRYFSYHLCYQLKTMSSSYFLENLFRLKQEFFRMSSIGKRLWYARGRTSLYEKLCLAGINLGYRQSLQSDALPGRSVS